MGANKKASLNTSVSRSQKTLLSTHLSAGAQAVAPNWDRYSTYQPGRPGVAAGADTRRRKDKPVVYRGEHGLPYVTDGVQVPPEDAFGSYEYDDELAMVTMDASELVDANDLAEPALAGGPERPQRPAGEEDAYGRLQPAQREGMYEVVAKQMKRELTVTRKRYVTDMERTLNDNVRLKAQVAALKENCDQQARHIQHQARALDEMRREGQQDVAMAYRLNYGAERRAATMQARLGVAAADQERAFAAAASQLEAMRRERDTLAEALAAVAEAAVGGQEATAAELASEARAAEDEGSDPLPRRPDSWVKFNYYVPPAHARRLASQRGDGERAVGALVAAVLRLHKRTHAALDKVDETVDHVHQLRGVIEKVDREYDAVAETVAAVEAAVDAVRRDRPPEVATALALAVQPAPAEGATLQQRLRAAAAAVRALGTELKTSDDARVKVEMQLLEMDFYSRLMVQPADAADDKPAVEPSSQ